MSVRRTSSGGVSVDRIVCSLALLFGLLCMRHQVCP